MAERYHQNEKHQLKQRLDDERAQNTSLLGYANLTSALEDRLDVLQVELGCKEQYVSNLELQLSRLNSRGAVPSKPAVDQTQSKVEQSLLK